MMEKEVLIEFKGILTFEIIGKLINQVNIKLSEIQESVINTKRVLTLMVETLENICKYSEQHKNEQLMDEKYPTTFVLLKREKIYFLSLPVILCTKMINSL